MKVDIQKARLLINDLNKSETLDPELMTYVARWFGAALNELEALRKPVSVTASLTWDVSGEAAIASAGAVSDNVMRAAEVCYLAARLGRTHEDWIARSDDEQRSYALTVRGVRTHPDAAPVDVDGAAEAAWKSDGPYVGEWRDLSESTRGSFLRIARAVLEYAVSIGLASPAKSRDVTPLPVLGGSRYADHPHVPAQPAPAVDSREERLIRYRCAALTGVLSSDDETSHDAIASDVETYAHAMLKAERSPNAV